MRDILAWIYMYEYGPIIKTELKNFNYNNFNYNNW